MKKSKKTIVYMLVALFVVVSVAFVDVGNCYAESYSEDVVASDWHSFTGGNSVHSEFAKEITPPDYLSHYDDFPDHYDVNDEGYVEDISFARRISTSNDICFTQAKVSSPNEIVYLAIPSLSESDCNSLYNSVSCVGGAFFGMLTLGSYRTVLHSYISYCYSNDNWKKNGSYANYKVSTTLYNHNQSAYYYAEFETSPYTLTDNSYYELSVCPGKMKVFTDVESAYNYLTTGDTSGLAWQGSEPKQTYSSELAFTSFDMSVHDSNSFDDYYLEFLYKCPDEWLGKNPKLVINQTWDYNVYYFDNKGTSSPLTVNGSNTCALSVSGDRNSIKIPLGQLDCLKEFVSNNLLGSSSEMKRRVLGNTFSSPGIAYKDFVLKAGASCNVDKSFLSLSCVVYVDGIAGHEYVGSVDLITGDNSMATYTPDPSGNYTFNDDYKKGGHYYTNVGKDAAGNTTYNYYYYTTDNSKHEVTSQDSHDNTYTTTEAPASGGGGSASGDNSNNNVNNPTFNNNNNITIEGDTINNDVNNIVGNNTSSETNKNFIEKFLGFFQLLENNSFLGVWGKVFGWLPPGISSVITTALGIGACVGLFRFFRR